MPQRRLQRKQEEIGYDAGGSVTEDLADSHAYVRLNLLMDYDVTVNTADSKNGTGILELLDTIRVNANGKNTIKKIGGPLQHYINRYKYATPPVYDPIDFSSTTTQTGKVGFFVDFVLYPKDYTTLFPAWGTSEFTLEVQWGNADDVGDVSVNSANIKVESHEILRNQIAAGAADNFAVFKERQKTRPIQAKGNTPVKLPTGNTYYAVPFLVVNNDSPSDTLVSEIQIEEDGVRTHIDTDFDMVQAKDKMEYNLESTKTGFGINNFGFRGNLDHVVPTGGVDEFNLNLETDTPDAPAEARVVTQELVMPE